MLKLNYDEQFDVLYVGVADNSNSYGAEQVNNVNIFRDVDSDCITGFVIFKFRHKLASRNLPVITEPFSIDFEKDVIPNLTL